MVDASNHQIGCAWSDRLQGQFDAIGGSARTFVDGDTFRLADGGDGDGQLRRDGTSHARTGAVGGNHNDVGHRTKETDQFVDALGQVAIVVGNEYERTL